MQIRSDLCRLLENILFRDPSLSLPLSLSPLKIPKRKSISFVAEVIHLIFVYLFNIFLKCGLKG